MGKQTDRQLKRLESFLLRAGVAEADLAGEVAELSKADDPLQAAAAKYLPERPAGNAPKQPPPPDDDEEEEEFLDIADELAESGPAGAVEAEPTLEELFRGDRNFRVGTGRVASWLSAQRDREPLTSGGVEGIAHNAGIRHAGMWTRDMVQRLIDYLRAGKFRTDALCLWTEYAIREVQQLRAEIARKAREAAEAARVPDPYTGELGPLKRELAERRIQSEAAQREWIGHNWQLLRAWLEKLAAGHQPTDADLKAVAEICEDLELDPDDLDRFLAELRQVAQLEALCPKVDDLRAELEAAGEANQRVKKEADQMLRDADARLRTAFHNHRDAHAARGQADEIKRRRPWLFVG